MKKILFLSGIVLASLVTSCQEEFLDSAPTETIGDAPVQTKLNGLYVMMINTGTGGTTDHDDFGQKGFDIYSDMLSQDMVLEGVTYGWYTRLANMSAQTDFTRTENYKPWRYYYRIIAGANDVIDGLGGTDTVPTTDDNKFAMGQAKAIRAYAYFYLMQLYTKGYTAGEPAIPVYTKTQQPAAPKSTQEQVYGLIVDDLTKAIDYLADFDRANKGMIDQGVAKGLLAYTYAAMGQYSQAATLSKQIMSDYGYPVTTKVQAIRMVHPGSTTASGGGFNSLDTQSWMWGYNLDVVNGLDLISWWGQVDVFTYSYAGVGDRKGIDLGLYNSMRADDDRRNQFVVTTPARNYPGNKFFDPNRVSMGQRQITTDYIFMRVDEFHLLAAESLAKSGQEAEAKTILKTYLQNRIADVSYIDALSGVALQNEIYKNTRLEFWGEGKSYLALKRNKATVTRGSNHLFLAGQSFTYDDDRMYLKIPQEEILNNPNF
ncbi:RagB/SusD family nutrient uptake outer membrane protein [Chryseobacterium sp. MMS23-Vi53]|uniref:RagB/SusD family nutrient uptake outer membrane protein n=1 Tax=Chryseobacterium sp. MMS23-Vi53 TaxID=3386644 RepID=UPI0039EBAB44